MDQPIPTRDPIEGLRFTFKSDEAARRPLPEWRTSRGHVPGPAHLHFGETPLTDPRSLGSSALVHVVLIRWRRSRS